MRALLHHTARATAHPMHLCSPSLSATGISLQVPAGAEERLPPLAICTHAAWKREAVPEEIDRAVVWKALYLPGQGPGARSRSSPPDRGARRRLRACPPSTVEFWSIGPARVGFEENLYRRGARRGQPGRARFPPGSRQCFCSRSSNGSTNYTLKSDGELARRRVLVLQGAGGRTKTGRWSEW